VSQTVFLRTLCEVLLSLMLWTSKIIIIWDYNLDVKSVIFLRVMFGHHIYFSPWMYAISFFDWDHISMPYLINICTLSMRIWFQDVQAILLPHCVQ
jgi:hypothetical protein